MSQKTEINWIETSFHQIFEMASPEILDVVSVLLLTLSALDTVNE